MKASDFMIGDWVNVPMAKLTARIDSILSKREAHNDACIVVDFNGQGYLAHYTENDLKPIPLTAEILEKNANGGCGYYDNKSRATYHLHKRKEEVSIYVEWERVYPEPYIELHGLGDTFFKGYCDSVSKLQHLLRICGLNELAENFKVK